MKFKSEIAAFFAALCLSSPSFAIEQLCPDIEVIKSQGLPYARKIENFFSAANNYYAYNTSNFDTNYSWLFTIAPVTASSEKKALIAANELLSTMTAPGVDMSGICVYDTGSENVMSLAIQVDTLISQMNLGKIFAQVSTLRHKNV